MASLNRSKAVVELGKSLAAQLNGRDDLLASWMAHYIAEKLEAAKRAPPKKRAVADDECAKAILQVWQHRNALPEGTRPFESLEPLLRTLASLRVDQAPYRHFMPPPRNTTTEPTERDRLFQLAEGIDYTARLSIEWILQEAGEQAVATGRPWIKRMRAAGLAEGVEGPTIDFLDPERNAPNRARDLEQVERLKLFVELATELVKDIKKRAKAGQKSPHPGDSPRRKAPKGQTSRSNSTKKGKTPRGKPRSRGKRGEDGASAG